MPSNIVIDKSQYRNFSCKLGRKNKVNKVIGNQYVIDAATSTSYAEGSRSFAPYSIGGSMEYREYHTKYTAMALFDWSAEYYLRYEKYVRTISFEFVVTGKTITNIGGMYANYTLYYNKYTSNQNLITASNYESSKSANIFSAIRSNSNRPSSSYDSSTGTYSEYDESTTTSIPMPVPNSYYSGETNTIGYIPVQSSNGDCKVTYISKSKNVDGVNYDYRFRVDLTFVVSYGANTVYLNWWTGNVSSQTINFNEVVRVDISVGGYTVSKEEVRAEYSIGGDESKVLELQTNEFVQQSIVSVPVGTGQSLVSFNDISNEIINAYKDNRLIVTFDLVNNKKYNINGVTRLLRAGDKIKIRDLEGKMLSSSTATEDDAGNDFEIIKANTKYDGFFYREIVAKEILNSN